MLDELINESDANGDDDGLEVGVGGAEPGCHDCTWIGVNDEDDNDAPVDGVSPVSRP